MTRGIAYSCGMDAANRSMRAAGRTSWSEEDAGIAAREFNRLWPLCQHGADQDCCALCDVDHSKARAEAVRNLTLNLGGEE